MSMKLYWTDAGWKGGVAVIANSREEALEKIQAEGYASYADTVDDLNEAEVGEVVFFSEDH